MEQQTLEGTWEEIAAHADDFAGQRLGDGFLARSDHEPEAHRQGPRAAEAEPGARILPRHGPGRPRVRGRRAVECRPKVISEKVGEILPDLAANRQVCPNLFGSDFWQLPQLKLFTFHASRFTLQPRA